MVVPAKHKLTAGFTLVEMAVVVTIMAILLTIGLAAANSVLQSTQRSSTKDKEAFIKDVLVNYFLTNHRLPCPDTGSNVGNTGRDGVENRAVGGANPDVTSACSAPVGMGTVPYVTLGISRSQALDAYGNFITYRLDVARNWHLTNTFTPAATCNIAGITAVPLAGLAVNSAVAMQDTAIAAVVLISHGANGLGAWNQGVTNASQNLPPATADELGNTQLNPGAPAAYRSYSYSDLAANPFDDILQFLTVTDISTVAVTKLSRPNICS